MHNPTVNLVVWSSLSRSCRNVPGNIPESVRIDNCMWFFSQARQSASSHIPPTGSGQVTVGVCPPLVRCGGSLPSRFVLSVHSVWSLYRGAQWVSVQGWGQQWQSSTSEGFKRQYLSLTVINLENQYPMSPVLVDSSLLALPSHSLSSPITSDKLPGHAESGPTLPASFQPSHSFKGPTSKYSYILRFWESELQHGF